MKRTKVFISLSICSIGLLAWSAPSSADDLNDNISSYTDDSIAADNNLGGEGINVKFKVLDAKSKAKVKETSKTKDDNKNTNINSVVMGAGSNVKGDIIIIGDTD